MERPYKRAVGCTTLQRWCASELPAEPDEWKLIGNEVLQCLRCATLFSVRCTAAKPGLFVPSRREIERERPSVHTVGLISLSSHSCTWFSLESLYNNTSNTHLPSLQYQPLTVGHGSNEKRFVVSLFNIQRECFRSLWSEASIAIFCAFHFLEGSLGKL